MEEKNVGIFASIASLNSSSLLTLELDSLLLKLVSCLVSSSNGELSSLVDMILLF
jgi:hypothetical protein